MCLSSDLRITYAFTEQGVIKLATIMRSGTAIDVSIRIKNDEFYLNKVSVQTKQKRVNINSFMVFCHISLQVSE